MVTWKTIVSIFSLIADGLTWKIGDKISVRLGEDLCVGSDFSHLLPLHMVMFLRSMGFYCLSQISNPSKTSKWKQGWIMVDMLGFSGGNIRSWEGFIGKIHSSHVCLQGNKISLVETHALNGKYTPKYGYGVLLKKDWKGDFNWWWKVVWKMHFL